MKKNVARMIWQKIKFNQKTEWDSIAYSFLKECDVILDVGCGEGRFISQNPNKIVGSDWNNESLKKCKNHNNNVVRCDARILPFHDESIAGIHCSHLIEHFFPQDVYRILCEVNRILKKGGILVIRSPLLWDGFYSDLTHIRPYNPHAIIHYLTPSEQRTLKHVSVEFGVIHLKWRYRPLQVKNRYFNAIFTVLNRWGFPWLEKNGYMIVMKNGNFLGSSTQDSEN